MDLGRAVGAGLEPYCVDLMTLMLQALQSPNLHRSVKPPVMSAFGDIAMGVNGKFEPFLDATMAMLFQASSTQVPDADEETVYYINQLREGALEAFAGITNGLKDGHRQEALVRHLPNLALLLAMLAADQQREDTVTKAACGLIGDLAAALGAVAAPHLKTAPVHALLQEAVQLEDEDITVVAQWAMAQVQGI